MQRMKYIVLDNNQFVMFSTGLVHRDVARGLDGTPVGAGFCNVMREADSEYANVHCWGESVSLGIESREQDDQIVNRYLKSY